MLTATTIIAFMLGTLFGALITVAIAFVIAVIRDKDSDEIHFRRTKEFLSKHEEWH